MTSSEVLTVVLCFFCLQAKRMVESFFDRLIPNRKARIELDAP